MLDPPRSRVKFQINRVAANKTASTTRDAAITWSPRTRTDIRRRRAYSWKQGEQLTTCETGRSFKPSCLSRFAIARNVEEFGQPSRVGFGKAVLEYFFPRATKSLTCLADADWLGSVITHFVRRRAVSIVSCGKPGIDPRLYQASCGTGPRHCEHPHI